MCNTFDSSLTRPTIGPRLAAFVAAVPVVVVLSLAAVLNWGR